MKITQGAFSYLADLGDDQILNQLKYAVDRSLAVSIEYTDDPHPRNAYWQMWGLPLFDMRDPSAIMFEIRMAKKYRRNYYIKLCCFDNARGVESCVLSFIVHRPQLYTLKPIYEPGFRMSRQKAEGRKIVYTLESYSVIARAEGERY